MHASNDTAPATLRRPESLIGVCAAIGEDFGFNPDFLRVPLAAGLLFSPLTVAIAYAGLALAVLASRLLFPKPKTAAPVAAVASIRPISDTADTMTVRAPLREAA